MRYRQVLVAVVAAAGMFLAQSAFAGMATTGSVYLKSDPGSWVGTGIGAPSVTWTQGPEGAFYGRPNYGDYKYGVQINYSSSGDWEFQFAAPSYDPVTNTDAGQLLHVGLYTDAQRFPFNSPTNPGINITGAGRGNNQQNGWFNVLEISYDTSGNLATFAVDFKQFDENSPTVGLYGSLRFNSSIPLNLTPVPEPGALALMLAGLACVGVAVRRKAMAAPLSA